MSNNYNSEIDVDRTPFMGLETLCASVKFNGLYLFSWVQTEESRDAGTVEITAIGQFGHGCMKVFSPNGEWVDQFVGDDESPAMTIPFEKIYEVTEQAVRAAMGDALDLTYHAAGDEGQIEACLNGERVLFWEKSADFPGEFDCLDASGQHAFMFFSASTHGFVPWNDGYSEYQVDSFGSRYIEQISPIAYRALREGWIVGGAA